MALSNNPAGVWARLALTKRVLDTVAGALDAAGVRALAVKGVVTSGWLYDDAAERPLTDLDLRIVPADLARVLGVAARNGWRVERHLRTYRSAVLEVDGIGVDVESGLGPPGVSSLGVAEVLTRASHQPGGYWVPEMHDHAVLLTVNVFKDKIAKTPPWSLEDVVRVVRAPGFDPATYVARVQRARLVGPAWLVADWMAEHRDHAEWRALRQRLGGASPARARYVRRMQRLLAGGRLESFEMRTLSRLASDDPRRWPAATLLAAVCELELRMFYEGRRSGWG